MQRCKTRRSAPERSLVLLLAIITIWNVPCVHSQPSEPEPAISEAGRRIMEVRSGADLVAAFADQAVKTAWVTADITLAELDFAAYATPIVRSTNFSVTGARGDPALGPIINLGLIRFKLYLSHGVRVAFTHVVLEGYRHLPLFQSPGLDLIVDSSGYDRSDPTAFALLDFRELIIRQRSCLPVDLGYESSTSLPRPTAFPGKQLVEPTRLQQPENDPTCRPYVSDSNNGGDSNSSSGHTSSPIRLSKLSKPKPAHCFPGVGRYVDAMTYCVEADQYGKPYRTGYVAWLYNSTYTCGMVLTTACIEEYGGPVGCYASLLGPMGSLAGGGGGGAMGATGTPVPLLPSAPVLASPGAGGPAPLGDGRSSSGSNNESGGDSGGGGTSTLALVLGCVLGGLVLLGVGAAAAVLVMMWRRRHRMGNLTSSSTVTIRTSPHSLITSSDGRGNGAAVVACCPPELTLEYGECNSSFHIAIPEAATTLCAFKGGRYPADRLLCSLEEVELLPLSACTPMQPSIPMGIQSIRRHTTTTAGAAAGDRTTGRTPGEHEAAGDGSSSSSSKVVSSSCQELVLLPVTLGKGSFGRVVEGLYGGVPVAVKLLDTGLLLPQYQVAAGGVAAVQGDAAVADEGDAAAGEAGEAVALKATAHEGECVVSQSTQSRKEEVRRDAPDNHPGLENMAQEVEVLARCRHDNVVRLLAANLSPGPGRPMCLVMERCDTSLDRLLYGRKPRTMLPLSKVLHIGIQVARALAYLHPFILHRDLKPANVLICHPDSDKPVAKLADFGLSRLHSSVLVTRNMEAGTGPYIAPEAFDLANTSITDRADIYSLGVLLWEMLSGSMPWADVALVNIAVKVTMRGERLPLTGLHHRVPRKLVRLVEQCFEADPRRRPAAADVVKHLALAAEQMEHP